MSFGEPVARLSNAQERPPPNPLSRSSGGFVNVASWAPSGLSGQSYSPLDPQYVPGVHSWIRLAEAEAARRAPNNGKAPVVNRLITTVGQ